MDHQPKPALPPVTLNQQQLDTALAQAVRWPHKKTRKGRLRLHPAIFSEPDRETSIIISKFAIIDCTGDIEIGPWCMISPRARLYTHDHLHLGITPLFAIEEAHGIVWQDKRIGADVWIHDSAFVLYQVTEIPDGVVLGAGSILTKNPGPYEIWAGNPARKIGTRTPMSDEAIEQAANRSRFRLDD